MLSIMHESEMFLGKGFIFSGTAFSPCLQ